MGMNGKKCTPEQQAEKDRMMKKMRDNNPKNGSRRRTTTSK